MSKTIFEEMNGTYKKSGDYLIPELKLAEKRSSEKEAHIGIWGERYRRYLKQNHKVIYYNYLTGGTLYEYLLEVDSRAENMFHQLIESLFEEENITEELKEKDMMLWIRRMNNIRNRAMEIVNKELIYI